MDKEKVELFFNDEKSKDLFMTVLNEYSSGLVDLMNKLSPSRGYGNGDASILISGDEIRVSFADKNKGTVLTEDGFIPYNGVDVGKRYMSVKEKKPAIYIKSEEDVADVLVGFAPDVDTMLSGLVGE